MLLSRKPESSTMRCISPRADLGFRDGCCDRCGNRADPRVDRDGGRGGGYCCQGGSSLSPMYRGQRERCRAVARLMSFPRNSKGEVNLWWQVRCMAVLAAHHTDSGSWFSTKQTIDAGILINNRPVHAKTTTGDLPVITLLLRRMQQSWLASEWNGNSPAVLNLDNKNVVCRTHIHDTRPRIHNETPPILIPA